MPEKSFLLNERIYRYVFERSLHEPEILRRLREETAGRPDAQMQIPPDQGQLFDVLLAVGGARKVLEVGVFTGYSSLRMALALPADGRIVACDMSEEFTSVARRYWREAGVEHKVELRLGPAAETLNQLIEEGHAETFDFAFIDADKASYRTYYEAALRLMREGGLIVMDNMLRDGKVVDAAVNDRDTVAIREMNDFVFQDGRVTASLLAFGDGITLAVKRRG